MWCAQPRIVPRLGIVLAGCLLAVGCTRSGGAASSASPLPAVDGGSGPPRGIPAPGGGGSGGAGSADAAQGEDATGDAVVAGLDAEPTDGTAVSVDVSATDAFAGADASSDGVGAADAAEQGAYPVHLPWPAGLAYEVVSTQELSAARDAYGPSYWAFLTPGTHLQVLAAVSGTVTAIVDDHAQGGGLANLAKYTNYVEITTDDGVSVRHLHLAQGTASPLVQVGAEVARGQLIGYSGASGFAASPRIGIDAVDASGDPIELCFVTPTSPCATPAPSMPVTSANTLAP